MVRRLVVLASGLFAAAIAAGAVYWFWPRNAENRPETSPAVKQVGTMRAAEITESSGVVESRKRPGIYWTHNDHGNRPAIFAIQRNGDCVNRFLIDAPNNDWEDIALDERGRLYIGDIGDNEHTRPLLYVYRLPEPDPRAPSTKVPLPIERRWQLRCPSDPLNCEALFIWQGYGYLISKLNKQHPAGLYRFPLDAPDEPLTLEHLGHLSIRDQVTAADIRNDGKLLAVLTYAGLYVYRIDGDVDHARKLQPMFIPIRGHKIEGCCFTTGGVFITSETREVYFCEATAYAALLEEPKMAGKAPTRPTTRPKRPTTGAR
ncbi:MAG: hypothetical protein ABSH20_02550 [Tepidisphaeraceae bacterium]|jgi:hypothetical protein